jgi:hypothetical protein
LYDQTAKANNGLQGRQNLWKELVLFVEHFQLAEQLPQGMTRPGNLHLHFAAQQQPTRHVDPTAANLSKDDTHPEDPLSDCADRESALHDHRDTW